MAHSADFQGTPALRMGKFWNYIEDVEHDTLWNINMVENDFFYCYFVFYLCANAAWMRKYKIIMDIYIDNVVLFA